MGLPFVIVEGTVLIVDVNGNIADIITGIGDGKKRLATQGPLQGGNAPYLNADVVSSGSQNRLAVTSQVASPGDSLVKYKTTKLLDGAVSEMTVDGSGTPVDYEILPGAGESFFAEYVRINLRDDGSLKLNDFGSGPALTNGLRVRMQSGGTLISDYVIKTNEELIDASEDIQTIEQFQGAPLLLFTIRFKNNITLVGDSSDFIRVTVQDDLTNIEALSAGMRHWETV